MIVVMRIEEKNWMRIKIGEREKSSGEGNKKMDNKIEIIKDNGKRMEMEERKKGKEMKKIKKRLKKGCGVNECLINRFNKRL